MTHKIIVDSFDIKDAPKWKIEESAEDESVVDGVNILGRAVGPFFMVGESRNKRFYSDELWNKAINENTDRMKDGTIIGTIGHTQKLDDQALLEGKASHRVSRLWLGEDGKTGMGEVLIFNTSAGRELNALLRGGMKLSISSRAAGEYKGRSPTGSQIIDPDSFMLEGFDFVQTPGVPGAVPVLVEHLDDTEDSDLSTSQQSNKSTLMSQELLESLAKDKSNLQGELTSVHEKLASVTRERDALVEVRESKDAEVTRLTESVNELTSKVTSLEESIKATDAKIAVYEGLGTPEEIQQVITDANALTEAYKEHGSPEELTEAFEGATVLIETYAELGKPEEIEKVLDIAESYSNIGTPESISEDLDILESYRGIGTVEEIQESLNLLEQYKELGTPEDINKAFDLTEGVILKMNSDKNESLASEISSKYDIEESAVLDMLDKHGKDETIVLIESIKGSSVGNRYKAPKEDILEVAATTADDINESVNVRQSRASRLMANQSSNSTN